jgi:long-subunit acyl-CoA synthetase (AMP-forming)
LIDGEIVVKSDMVRTGYYNNGEETGKVFKNGWYHTGVI